MNTLVAKILNTNKKYLKIDIENKLIEYGVSYNKKDTKPVLEQKLIEHYNSLLNSNNIESDNDTLTSTLTTAYRKKSIPQRLRMLVWDNTFGPNARHGVCYCCRTTKISIEKFECGHNISERDGGNTTVDNLKPICSQCNRSMGTNSIDEFRSTLSTNSNIQIKDDIENITNKLKLIIIETPCEIPDSIQKLWENISNQSQINHEQISNLAFYGLTLKSMDLDSTVIKINDHPELYERLRYIYYSLHYWDLLPRFFNFQSVNIQNSLYQLHLTSICIRLADTDYKKNLITYLNQRGIFDINDDNIVNIVIRTIVGYSSYRDIHSRIIF
jgi:5-methylcytosine-specific restriction endonuclease McrA